MLEFDFIKLFEFNMFVCPTLRFSLDNLSCCSHFPKSRVKSFAVNLLKGFGVLLAGYMTLSLASHTLKNLDKDALSIGGTILAIIVAVAITVILTVSVIQKFFPKKESEINALDFEYETITKEWQLYNDEKDEYLIDLHKCLEQQKEIILKQNKVKALITTAKIVISEGRFYNLEKMNQEITIVLELCQRNDELVNDLLVLGEALNEKHQQLTAWQTKLDAWFDKIKS